MASRSISEVWLRPSPLARICHIPTSRRRIVPLSHSIQRGISNSPYQSAAQPQLKEAEEAEQHYDAEDPQSTPSSSQPQHPQRRALGTLDALFHHPPKPNVPQTQTTSSEEMRAARMNRVFGSDFSPPGRARRPQGLAVSDMEFPEYLLDPSFSNKPSEAASLKLQQEETLANYPRLNAAYGRTIELDAARGRDLVRGLSMLSSLVARNKMKVDLRRQKYHERGGLKRKRLKSERWRARFKAGFEELTKRVTKLTRKGW